MVSVEGDQAVLDELLQELVREEGIAGRLPVDQLRQWRRPFSLRMKRVGEPLDQIFRLERPKPDFWNKYAALANRRERPHQRVRRIDLVVPKRADEEQVLPLGLDEDVFQELERRGVEPLQIVQEQGQRVLSAREHTDETSKNHLKAGLRVRGRNVWNGRLLSDDELQFRDEVGNERTVGVERLMELVSPFAQLG